MSKFKVGDRVRVVIGSGSDLASGSIYTVTDVSVSLKGYIRIDNGLFWWMPERFVLDECSKIKMILERYDTESITC